MKRDLDEMIRTMRGVKAPVGFAPTLAARRGTGVRLLRPALAAGVLILAGGLALRPAPAEARGWASAVSATRAAAYRHETNTGGGSTSSESWSGPGVYVGIGRVNGKIYSESRSDGRRIYDLFDFSLFRGSNNLAANALIAGTVRDLVRRTRLTYDEGGRASIEEVLKTPDAKKIAPPAVEPGEGQWYEVPLNYGTLRGRRVIIPHLARVGTDGRLAESRYVLQASPGFVRTLYNYPATLPEGFFEPRPQARAVPVIDFEATRAEMARRMAAGYGTVRGVTLRLVLIDKEGTLFAFWTGPGVVAGSGRDVRLPGVRTGPAKGLWSYPAQTKSPAKRGVAPVIGKPLSGRGIVPLQRIGSTVTIAVPGVGAQAVFRGVPVLRVDEVRPLRGILGYGG